MRCLLVIDVQPEFATEQQRTMIESYIKYNKFDKVFRTFFRNYYDSNFQKLLNYNGCMNIYVPEDGIIKRSYLLPNWVVELLKTYDSVEVIGCDIEACVLAACFQLFDANINFTIKTDLCFSSHDTIGNTTKNNTLRLMRQCFGKAVKYY